MIRLVLSAVVVLGWLSPAVALQGNPEAAAAQQAPPTCPADEGKPVAGPQGLTFCSDPARIDNPALGGLQEGVRILAVATDSAAEAEGFRAGDIIYRIGGVPVNTGEAAVKRLAPLRPNEEVVLNFWRDALPFLIRLRG